MIAVWWNVERLFQPNGSSIARSLGIGPSSGWDRSAYRQKIHNVASVLLNIASNEQPAIIGLGEIENDRVISDLLNVLGWKNLKAANDPNENLDGHDVILLFDSQQFAVADTPISHNVHNRFSTRDILEVKLELISNQEIINVFVNHWPSRLLTQSTALRIGLADYTERLIESLHKFEQGEMVNSNGDPQLPAKPLLEERWNTKTLIIGDFNDNPYDVTISEILRGTRSLKRVLTMPKFPKGTGSDAIARYLSRRIRFFNPTWYLFTEGGLAKGTSIYQGEWHLLDQILLSRGVLTGPGIRYLSGSLRVHAPKTVPGIRGGDVDCLTRAGNPKSFDARTGRGVSDHLPLVWELEVV